MCARLKLIACTPQLNEDNLKWVTKRAVAPELPCDRMCSILPMSCSLCNLPLMFTPIISACESVYIFSVAGFRHKMAVAGWWSHVVEAPWSNRLHNLCSKHRRVLLGTKWCSFFFFCCFYWPCLGCFVPSVAGGDLSLAALLLFFFSNCSCTTWTNYNMEKVDLCLKLSACFIFAAAAALAIRKRVL